MKAYGTGGTAPTIPVYGCGAESGHVVHSFIHSFTATTTATLGNRVRGAAN